MKKHLSHKNIVIAFVSLAVFVGLLASVLPPDKLMTLIAVEKFFEAMIPILGVAALLKYITCDLCEKHK